MTRWDIQALDASLEAGACALWVHQQAYPNPYPKELMLRNHVEGWETAFAEERSLSERTLYFHLVIDLTRTEIF